MDFPKAMRVLKSLDVEMPVIATPRETVAKFDRAVIPRGSSAATSPMTLLRLGWPDGVRPAASPLGKPTSIEPVKAMKSICGEAMSRLPTSEPRAGDAVEDSRREAGSEAQPDHLRRHDGRVVGGVEQHGVAARDSGVGHPADDGEREIHGEITTPTAAVRGHRSFADASFRSIRAPRWCVDGSTGKSVAWAAWVR
jgi:hypothetical protein